MKLRDRCETCRKPKFFVRKRTFIHRIIGKITSQGEICGSCWRKLKETLKTA